MARILVVDDHPIMRRGLTQMINQESDLSVCGEAAEAAKALDAVATLKPDLAIVDLSLRRGDGLDLIKAIRKQDASIPILVLTMHEEAFYAERALRAGAQGFLTKSEAGAKVLIAIRQLLEGEVYVSDQLSPKLLKKLLTGTPSGEGDSVVSRLSDRELQVFKLTGKGWGTQEIADELNLSVKTIETYRAHIKEKLDLRDSRELIQYAIRWMLSQGGK